MKKWITLAAALLMVMTSALALAEWAAVDNPDPADKLNLRAKPSTSSISYGKYFNGAKVQILSGPSRGWYRVRVGLGNGVSEIEGYMKAQYLALGEAAEQVVDARPQVTLENPDGDSILLKDFITGSNVGKMKNGEKATVLGVGIRYLHVVTEDGDTGLVPVEWATPKIEF